MNQPISSEQLITELTIENTKLKADLEEAQRDLLEFERLAKEWKKSYGMTELRLKVKIEHLEQTIEEMNKENASNHNSKD